MQVDALCPEAYTGAVIGDLNRRRGRITGLEATVQGQAISATVPLSEMFGYVASLRGLSAGTGSYTMRLSHYAQVSQALVTQ